MTSSLKKIEEQARALNPDDRAKLVESLLESLHIPVSEFEGAWAHEIERRVDAFDLGELPGHAAEDVLAEARRLAR